MSADLSSKVRRAVMTFLTRRVKELDAPVQVTGHTDVFATGIVDSMELANLVAFVEEQVAVEIDFIEVDPDGLDTVDGIAQELANAASSI